MPFRSVVWTVGVAVSLILTIGLAACDLVDVPDRAEEDTTPEATESEPDGEETTPEATATEVAAGTPRPAPTPAQEGLYGFGEPADEETIAEVDIDIPPDGSGLPDGSGTPDEGAEVFAEKCAHCHGETGREGGIGGPLVSEPGPFEPGMPRTIGSYWPYATTVYDYINRAMPFDNPGSLTPEEVYALVAYLFHENQIIEEDVEMNAETLPEVEMPNFNNFDPCWPDECRPDVTPTPGS